MTFSDSFKYSLSDSRRFLLIKFLNLLSNSSSSNISLSNPSISDSRRFLNLLPNSSSNISLSNPSISDSSLSSSPNIAYSKSLTISFKALLLTFFFTFLNSSRASFLFLTRSLFILSIKVQRVNNSNEFLSPLYIEKTSEAIFLYNCKSFIHDKSIKLVLSSFLLSSFPLSSFSLSSFPLSLGFGGLAGIITLPAKLSVISFSNFVVPSS